MTTKPRRESYRITLNRDDSLRVGDIKLILTDALVARGITSGKIELIRKSKDLETPRPWWRFW